MEIGLASLVALVLLALVFDFLNGFHDSANAIATVVSTGTLRPAHAVLWAAFFHVAAFFVFDLTVAATVGKGLVQPGFVDAQVVFGALAGAIAWNLATWWFGMPSSSSHALIGGLAGAALAKGGVAALALPGIAIAAAFVVLSPLLGLVLGGAIVVAVAHLARRAPPRRADRWLRRLQLVSSALYSLGHGSNDAQKTMGVIWMLLIAAGATGTDELPGWVVFACYLALALGTLLGGWRIVRTMGRRITRLRPLGGVAAETGGAIAILGASLGGVPVSSTQTITGAIVGAGTAHGAASVRWALAGDILWVWAATLPGAAAIGAGAWWLSRGWW